jgi:hypothetical protein
MADIQTGDRGTARRARLTKRLDFAAGVVLIVLAAWWLPVAWWYLHLDTYGFQTGPGPSGLGAAFEALVMVAVSVVVMSNGVRLLRHAEGALRTGTWFAAVFAAFSAAKIFGLMGGSSGTFGDWGLPERSPWWLTAALSGWPGLLGCSAVLALSASSARVRRSALGSVV